MATARSSPRRTRYSRAEAPLESVRERDAGNGQLVRMVKVRMDGPTGLRWVPFAKWWWERNRGPVPPGKRVCHADGNLMNDDPDNLVLLTPGEVFQLYHRLDPEMSRRNHAACGRSAAARNVAAGVARRATTWLPWSWYAVDFAGREIHNAPRRKRWMVYADHGLFERLAGHLQARAAAAKAGDTAAAAYVLTQADRLPRYWRWVRPASLGWPGLNCMSACVLAALADAGGEGSAAADLLDAVRSMRELFGWSPARLERGVFYSCVSSMGEWVVADRRGSRTVYSIGPGALAARVDGSRVVPVRGRHLGHARFEGFAKITPPVPAEGGFNA
ncbi:MAG: hypothetical protein JWO31_3778 [Phycisphaerales bacterium]|nr:hypothetical protein [Phycisphaerales bacterium]